MKQIKKPEPLAKLVAAVAIAIGLLACYAIYKADEARAVSSAYVYHGQIAAYQIEITEVEPSRLGARGEVYSVLLCPITDTVKCNDGILGINGTEWGPDAWFVAFVRTNATPSAEEVVVARELLIEAIAQMRNDDSFKRRDSV